MMHELEHVVHPHQWRLRQKQSGASDVWDSPWQNGSKSARISTGKFLWRTVLLGRSERRSYIGTGLDTCVMARWHGACLATKGARVSCSFFLPAGLHRVSTDLGTDAQLKHMKFLAGATCLCAQPRFKLHLHCSHWQHGH
eukprot:5170347-Amphidinium_carterae.2